MTSPYRVVEADLDSDRETIVGIWARNFPVHTHEEHRLRFAWNYESGPFGPGRCWLLLHRDGAVGTAGLGFRRLCAAGAPIVAGVASDLAVDASHRCLQPALMMQRALMSAVGPRVQAIYGTPNRKSESLFRHLHYEEVGAATRWVKVLRTEPFVRGIESAPLRFTAGLLAPAANLAIRAASRETWRLAKGATVRQIASYDTRFDGLWTRTAPVQGTASCRNARFLTWRYSRYPLMQYSTLAVLNSTEDLVLGYCVLYPCGDEETGIADFWADPRYDRSADDLMAAVIRWCRSRGAASITATFRGAGMLREIVQRFGFVARHPDGTLMARGCTDSVLQALGRWCFMPGDEDYN